jgi:putative transcriptional regulator
MSAAGEKILSSIREGRAVLRGEAEGNFVVHVPEAVNVKAIRRQLGMSQAQFAAAFGLELDAIRNWEQGRRRPEGAARAFLKVIEREPEAVQRALVA